MPSPAHFPIEDEEDPFVITAPLEIRGLLRSIQQHKALLRMYAKGGSASAVTTILEINPDEHTLIVDNAPDELVNKRLLSADQVEFETSLEKVQIHFSSAQLQACQQAGQAALRLAIPASMRRMQRREYYRIETPVTDPPHCTFNVDVANRSAKLRLSVRDMSAGGLAVIDNDHALDTDWGALYDRCLLELPQLGEIETKLKVVQYKDESLPGGKERRLVGCQFVDPSSALQVKVQNYISGLERKLSAKRRGYE